MTSSPHATRLLDVRARLGNLGPDELEALDYQLLKLERGALDHGPLDLDEDPRNWPDEISEEFLDVCWYVAFEIIKRKRVRDRRIAQVNADISAGVLLVTVDPNATPHTVAVPAIADPVSTGLIELRDTQATALNAEDYAEAVQAAKEGR